MPIAVLPRVTVRILAVAFALHATTLDAQTSPSAPALVQTTSTPCPVDWKPMQPGLDYRAIACIGDPTDLDLHIVRVDLHRWILNAAKVERGVVSEIAKTTGAAFVINANFFDRNGRALGAVVRSGEIVQPPHASSWQSIFGVAEDGNAHVILPSAWKLWKNRLEMAVQAGPRLVAAGHVIERLKDNYAASRAGVCIRKNGDVLFFATPKTRRFQVTEIARVAQRQEGEGGLACADAMLFDGGHSVNFRVEGDDGVITVEQDRAPVFVVAVRKE